MTYTQFEKTDTYGGELNYSWVRRWYTDELLTEGQAVRLAKKLAGFTGMRCRKVSYDDEVYLFPSGICQAVGIRSTDYPEGEKL